MFFFNLSSDASNVMDLFNINSLKFNQGKFQIMVLIANKNDSFKLNVVSKVIPSSSEVKLLGITNDNELIKKKQKKKH